MKWHRRFPPQDRLRNFNLSDMGVQMKARRSATKELRLRDPHVACARAAIPFACPADSRPSGKAGPAETRRSLPERANKLEEQASVDCLANQRVSGAASPRTAGMPTLSAIGIKRTSFRVPLPFLPSVLLAPWHNQRSPRLYVASDTQLFCRRPEQPRSIFSRRRPCRGQGG